ncbi:MAG TPA: sugar ABC transporter permease, partial [Candidatus Ozemobacteraceae bacterium]|nr:sugar ABC transporter permease [Candidatus Ozemobacteraceae bacterium]
MSAPQNSRETASSLLFLSPFLILFSVFLLFPILYSLYLSFYDSSQGFGLTNLRWVGLSNYFQILGIHWEGGAWKFNDPAFWWSLAVTFLYGGLSIPLGIAAALFLALLLNNKLYGKSFFRSAFFLPNILDMLVVGVIWTLIYAPKYGALAQISSAILGPEQFFNKVGPLASPYTALPAIVFAMVLKGAGFGMVLFLAALQNIPEAVYEAADIDGATKTQQFWYITLPLLQPIIFFMVITGIIGSLNAFTEIYAMTAGGPQIVIGEETLGSTSVAGYYLYKQFEGGRFGYAAAISYVLLAITLGITWIQQRFFAG